MKCLVCNKNDGSNWWWLSELDFMERGVNKKGVFKAENCFCQDCYSKGEDERSKVDKLDDHLFDYWLSIQSKKEETTLKYPTKEQYPEGYKWFVFDEDGRAFWSRNRPFYKIDSVKWNCGSDWQRAYDFDVDFCSNWKETSQCKDDLKEETKPNYYTWHPVTACVKVSEQFSGNLAQALQYIWRSETLNPKATTKGQTKEEIVKDLEKAQDFIGFEIQRLREGK